MLFDQRGVGFSRPALDCPELLAVVDLAVAPAAAALCRERLRFGTDLSRYTTEQNAKDVDLVRRALSYRRVNLLANSYGTDLALAVMRGDPRWVRSALLSSPAPPQSNFIADAGPSYQRALDALLAACRADAACNAAHPDLAARLDALIRQLAAQPASVSVPDPRTGRPVVVPITAGLVSALLYQLFYVPFGPALLPALVEELAAGRSVAQAFIDYNPIIGTRVFDLCEAIDVPPRPSAARAVGSAVPALVVTGEFDQITPPSYGRQAVRSLSRGRLIAARGVGHSPILALGGCGERIMRAFFGKPRRAPAAACARRPVRFLAPEAAAARRAGALPRNAFAFPPR